MASGGFSQEALRALWLSGATGKLSAMSQTTTWALREAWRATHDTTYGMLVFVAKHVEKVGGGRPTLLHLLAPCCLPIPQLFASGGERLQTSTNEAAGQKGVAHIGGNPIFKSQEALAPVCNRQVRVFS